MAENKVIEIKDDIIVSELEVYKWTGDNVRVQFKVQYDGVTKRFAFNVVLKNTDE